MKLAGAVTFYHCDVNKFLDNIQSYLDELDVLYVLDNNEQVDPDAAIAFSEYSTIEYIAFGENRGIASAFNFALQKAEKDGYEFLLTMDQDSSFLSGMMSKYKKIMNTYETSHPGGIAVYSVNFDPRYDTIEQGVRQIRIAITSGSIIPVHLSLKLGGFDEKLFIDEVDTEFCYRAEKAGYKIIEFPDVIMKHSIGNRTYHHFLGRKFNTMNHNAIRKYYITRNKIYVMRKYPEVKKNYIKDIIKMTVKVILAENDKKCKLHYIMGG